MFGIDELLVFDEFPFYDNLTKLLLKTELGRSDIDMYFNCHGLAKCDITNDLSEKNFLHKFGIDEVLVFHEMSLYGTSMNLPKKNFFCRFDIDVG